MRGQGSRASRVAAEMYHLGKEDIRPGGTSHGIGAVSESPRGEGCRGPPPPRGPPVRAWRRPSLHSTTSEEENARGRPPCLREFWAPALLRAQARCALRRRVREPMPPWYPLDADEEAKPFTQRSGSSL
eukprot:7678156-Pyramimonas_sp.AAC.1